MALGIDEVRSIAALARLALTPAEEVLFGEQLNDIVDYIDQLREFETDAREDALPGSPTCRESAAPEADDTVAGPLPRKRFLANAPQVLDAYLVVPRIMDPASPGNRETEPR